MTTNNRKPLPGRLRLAVLALGLLAAGLPSSARGEVISVWEHRVQNDASDLVGRNASTGVPVGSGLMIVADDDLDVLRVYPRHPVTDADRRWVQAFDFGSRGTGELFIDDGRLTETPSTAIDLECSTRIGDRIFWSASHSNDKSGDIRRERERLFATDVTIAPDGRLSLQFVGRYDHLRTDLVAWDASRGNPLGLAKSTAKGVSPEKSDGSGFNLEGLAAMPDVTGLFLGFRAPLTPVSKRKNALVIPLLNPGALVGATPARGPNPDGSGLARFGEPIELDLDGLGIRSMEGNGSGYIVIGGDVADSGLKVLYTWTGRRGDVPVRRSVYLQSLDSRPDFNVEGIVEISPGPPGPATVVELLSDDGGEVKPTWRSLRAVIEVPETPGNTPQLRNLSVSPDGTRVRFDMRAKDKTCYEVLWTPTLLPAAWTSRGTLRTDSNGQGSYTDIRTGSTPSSGYYGLRACP